MKNSLEAGLQRYFSEADLAALRAARVGIIGAGGLGSNIAMMLARSGVRQFFIADHDVVDASNLNRQAFLPGDVGQSKVLALGRHLRELEPKISVTAHVTVVDRVNAAHLFETCSIVVEAVDDAATKAMLYEVFAPIKTLYVTATGMGGFGGGDRVMTRRMPRPNVVVVGDFASTVDEANPPFAPRVMQAAAMQADVVLEFIVSGENTYA